MWSFIEGIQKKARKTEKREVGFGAIWAVSGGQSKFDKSQRLEIESRAEEDVKFAKEWQNTDFVSGFVGSEFGACRILRLKKNEFSVQI